MSTTSQMTSKADGFALGLIATGAGSVGIAALVSIVFAGVSATAQTVTVTRMPIAPDHPDAPVDAGTAIVGSAYEKAAVTFSDLPAWIRWMLWGESALPALATIGVCAVAWWLALALMRARPFRRAMPAAIATVACIVIGAGILSQLLGGLARAGVVELLESSAPEAAGGFWTFLIELDLAPVGWGIALALIAGAFGIGTRLQRDTEGLV